MAPREREKWSMCFVKCKINSKVCRKALDSKGKARKDYDRRKESFNQLDAITRDGSIVLDEI
ncbi:hypothetical protein HI914_05893 [Erysiphe necator]|nr:hypothetical protein HI914_05893 [Erysiphe necator]